MSSPAISLSLSSYASIIAARISGTLASSAATSTTASTTASTTTAASNTTTASAQGGGIILSATPPPNAVSAAQSALMELNSNNSGSSLTNSLLNNAAQQLQSTRALPPELLKPQVIEALVLKSTLLATPGSGSTQTPSSQPATLPANPQAQQQAVAQAKVELAWQGRVLQLLSAQPLSVGSQVRIEVTTRGELKLLPPQLANTAPNTSTTRPTEPALPAPLQQSLRENLPRQRPLTELQPLLQRLLTPATLPKLPAPVAAALQQLAASLPKPQQLQSAEGVRRAVERSGNFLEARVATPTPALSPAPSPTRPGAAVTIQPVLANTAQRAQPTTITSGKTAPPIDATPARATPATDSELLRTVQATADAAADGDLKAQLLQLVALIRRFAPAPSTTALETLPDQLYSAKPQPKQVPVATPVDGGERELEQLQQLSRLLQGGLARIQMNQLDGAASRHVSGGDTQAPVPSWSFELPIQTARGAENLQLRIEQQARQQDGVRKMQWKVQLAFDLHELGKLAATLTITGSNVAATLWAEQQHTHRVVRAEVDHFKAALEGVGVRVTEVQCRLGLPPEQKHRWQQQLVDVRT